MKTIMFLLVGVSCGVFVALAFPELGQPQSAIASGALAVAISGVAFLATTR